MTPKLAARPSTESQTAESIPDTFPYAEGETGLPLPAAAARGVLAAAEPGDSPEPAPATDPTRCPDCGGALVNGAGLFACGECGWYGSLR